MRVVSIHQPSYFPWLGLLDKIRKSDLFILMDEVQLADRAYQHRNIFLTKSGSVKYLTINFPKRNYRFKKINELKTSNPNWKIQHKNFLKENYRNTAYFKEGFGVFENFLALESEYLIDYLEHSMKLSLNILNISTPIIKMSELPYDKNLSKADLIYNLVEVSELPIYLTGTGALKYLKIDEFTQRKIIVDVQNFTHPEYAQKNSESFVSGLSCLDMFFNIGIEKSKEKLINNGHN